MKKIFLLVVIGFFNILTAQITKGFWLMGGNFQFEYYNLKNTEYDYNQGENVPKSNSNQFRVKFSPNVGYFFMDKLAGGIRGHIGYLSEKGETSESRTFRKYGFDKAYISPFIRYYFLPEENIVNVFGEADYLIPITGSPWNKEINFNIKGGVVYFLNTSVGLEAFINYNYNHLQNEIPFPHTLSKHTYNRVNVGIGLQIHLEKKR